MKKVFIVGNWKSNMTRSETIAWFEKMENDKWKMEDFNNKTVIVCPPFVLLPRARQSTQEHNVSISLGAQDISPFAQGAYTGEVHGGQIKEYAEYVIIGHSERRLHFQEMDEMIAQKVAQAKASGLIPILCIQGKDTPIPDGVTIVAYEPVGAIGTGNPDTPEDAESVAKAVRLAHPSIEHVLYGGSVTKDNVHTFTSTESTDGVLVGGASLDPEHFAQIIANA